MANTILFARNGLCWIYLKIEGLYKLMRITQANARDKRHAASYLSDGNHDISIADVDFHSSYQWIISHVRTTTKTAVVLLYKLTTAQHMTSPVTTVFMFDLCHSLRQTNPINTVTASNTFQFSVRSRRAAGVSYVGQRCLCMFTIRHPELSH